MFYLYTIFINIVCVSWEGPSLIESSQQICDFYKSVTFEKQRHSVTLYSKFLISVNQGFPNNIQVWGMRFFWGKFFYLVVKIEGGLSLTVRTVLKAKNNIP